MQGLYLAPSSIGLFCGHLTLLIEEQDERKLNRQ